MSLEDLVYKKCKYIFKETTHKAYYLKLKTHK